MTQNTEVLLALESLYFCDKSPRNFSGLSWMFFVIIENGQMCTFFNIRSE